MIGDIQIDAFEIGKIFEAQNEMVTNIPTKNDIFKTTNMRNLFQLKIKSTNMETFTT